MPAGELGMTQHIEISPVSGLSNVRYWLEERGYDSTDDDLCRRILDHAKHADRTLTESDVLSVMHGGSASS